MASREEYERSKAVVGSASTAMDISLFLPLLLQAFQSLDLFSIWSAVSMLQLVALFLELEKLKLTAKADMLLNSLDITVNFKLAKHPWVKEQI